jgi:hypothetical protein
LRAQVGYRFRFAHHVVAHDLFDADVFKGESFFIYFYPTYAILTQPKVCLTKLYQTRKFCCIFPFFSLELLILFILLNMFISEEQQEVEAEVSPCHH